MKTTALIAITALAMGAVQSGAAERFRPAAPDYVVLRVPARAQNDPTVMLEQRYRVAPGDQQVASQLAASYVERARLQREPRYFGRAETLLQPWIARKDASSATLRVQADILQNRHDFESASKLLDLAIEREPRDAEARLMRASVQMVQGRSSEARSDCAAVLGGGEVTAGTVCLAQVLGNSGKLAQAEALLKNVLARGDALPEQVRGWALWVQADFADRRGDLRAAEELLRQALRAEPSSEGIRSALCDVLIARGSLREALATVDLPAPSMGLLVRKAVIQKSLGHVGLASSRAQIREILSLSQRRGERPHLREEALLALYVDDDFSAALQLAKANFEVQRETLDARLLMRAARAAGDGAAVDDVLRWIRVTGFEDRSLAEIRT